MSQAHVSEDKGQEVTEQLMSDIAAAFNSRDVDRIVAYFHDECTFTTARGPHAPYGLRVHGKERIREYLGERFKVIPDMSWHHNYHYVCGDRAVSVWTVVGTSANGEELNYRGCDLWEFKDGKVFDKDTYWKIIDRDY